MEIKQEKEQVKILGEVIGYGNMMQLASELWKEMMQKRNEPVSGVFVPALPCDVRRVNNKQSESNCNITHVSGILPINELKKTKCYKCGADMYSEFSGNWHDSENCDKPKKAFNYSQEA